MATKKSPRAPSLSLDEALDKAVRVYEKERLHAAPTDIIAQGIGYKSANNGAALSALASLRYYGLLERPKEGSLAVTADVETYLYAPDEERKRALRLKWLRSPAIFQELTEKYTTGLPSDANLRFELINQGFIPRAAESLVAVFKRSVDFAGLYQGEILPETISDSPPLVGPSASEASLLKLVKEDAMEPPRQLPGTEDGATDRIPVRLHGNRRAWLLIPVPFYERDKERLHSHIDLLLTDDQDSDAE